MWLDSCAGRDCEGLARISGRMVLGKCWMTSTLGHSVENCGKLTCQFLATEHPEELIVRLSRELPALPSFVEALECLRERPWQVARSEITAHIDAGR